MTSSKLLLSKVNSEGQLQATLKNTIILFVLSLQNSAKVMLLFSLGIIASPRRKWKQCLSKILEGQTKSIMVFFKVAYEYTLKPSKGLYLDRHKLLHMSPEMDKKVYTLEVSLVIVSITNCSNMIGC